MKELDAVPLPAWDLVDGEAYRRAWTDTHGRFSWNMISSRGCPFGCNWCAKPIFGRRYTQRSPENVANEIAQLRVAVRPDHIWFADDIFGLTAKWVTKFAEEIVARDARTPFMIQCRADLLTPDVVAALAGGKGWIGVESARSAFSTRWTRALRWRKSAMRRALKAQGFARAGSPAWLCERTWDDLLMTRDFVRASGRTTSVFGGVSVAGHEVPRDGACAASLDRTGSTRMISHARGRTDRSSIVSCTTSYTRNARA